MVLQCRGVCLNCLELVAIYLKRENTAARVIPAMWMRWSNQNMTHQLNMPSKQFKAKSAISRTGQIQIPSPPITMASPSGCPSNGGKLLLWREDWREKPWLSTWVMGLSFLCYFLEREKDFNGVWAFGAFWGFFFFWIWAFEFRILALWLTSFDAQLIDMQKKKKKRVPAELDLKFKLLTQTFLLGHLFLLCLRGDSIKIIYIN